MKKRWLEGVIFCVIVMFSSGFMFGCSSSDDDDDVAATAPGFIGQAIDGALANANVYIDINGNGIQDTGEPFTITDDDGNFELTGFDIVEGAIVVVESNDSTIDISTGKSFVGKLKSKAPAPTAGKLNTSFITPVTTLILDAQKKDPTKTDKEILTSLGLGDFPDGEDIFKYNPLKETANDDPARAALAIKFNQVQAKIIAAANVAAAAVTGAGTGLDQSDMFAAALESFGAEAAGGTMDLTPAGMTSLTGKLIDAAVVAAKAKDTTFDDTKTTAAKASSGSLVASFAAQIDTKTTLAGLAQTSGAAAGIVKTVSDAVKADNTASIDDASAGLEANINSQTINENNLIPKDPTPTPVESGSTGQTT